MYLYTFSRFEYQKKMFLARNARNISSHFVLSICLNLKIVLWFWCPIKSTLVFQLSWNFVWVSFNILTTNTISFNDIIWKKTVLEPLSWVLFFLGHPVLGYHPSRKLLYFYCLQRPVYHSLKWLNITKSTQRISKNVTALRN